MKNHLMGKKIAVLLGEGADEDEVEAVLATAVNNGGRVTIVGSGVIHTSTGREVETQSITGDWDGILVAGGDISQVSEYVREALGDGTVVAAIGEGVAELLSTGISAGHVMSSGEVGCMVDHGLISARSMKHQKAWESAIIHQLVG